jgi:hypothetical protein
MGSLGQERRGFVEEGCLNVGFGQLEGGGGEGEDGDGVCGGGRGREVGGGLGWEEGARGNSSLERVVVQGTSHLRDGFSGNTGVGKGAEGEDIINPALVGDGPMFCAGVGIGAGVGRGGVEGREVLFLKEGGVLVVLGIHKTRRTILGVGHCVPIS